MRTPWSIFIIIALGVISVWLIIVSAELAGVLILRALRLM
jgi:hypothetical protein